MGVRKSGGGLLPVRFKLTSMIFLVTATSLFQEVSCQRKYHSTRIIPPQCAQVGQGHDFVYNVYSVLKFNTNSYTIGGEKFRTWHAHWMAVYDDYRFTSATYWNKLERLDEECPFDFKRIGDIVYSNAGYIQHVCTDQVEIRAYAVKQGDKTLRGWLHIEVELTDKADNIDVDENLRLDVLNNSMKYVYVEVRDENFNAIGEFVLDEKEQCKRTETKDYLVSPSKYQALPCSATGAKEYQTSKALFMATEDMYLNLSAAKPYMQTGDLTRGIYFTWKLNEYECNKHERFRIDATVFTKLAKDYSGKIESKSAEDRLSIRLQRKVTQFWIYPLWFGAADIKQEGDLDCTEEAVNFATGKVHPSVSNWIDSKTLKYALRNDYFNPALKGEYKDPDSPEGKHIIIGPSCQLQPWTNATFGGRCEDDVLTKNASLTHLHTCSGSKSNVSLGHLNVTYTNYIENLFNRRLSLCNKTCPIPGKKDVDDIKKIPTTKNGHKSTTFLDKLKAARNPKKRNYIWTCRKIHAQTCLLAIFLFMPISNFLSRYYKETFMSTRWYGCAPWFWIHVGCSFSMIVIFASGRRSLYTYYGNWGHDTEPAATTHRALGNLVIIIFVIMCATGFNRPVKPFLRIIFSAAHAIAGFTVYLVSISLVISSQDIAMSPTSTGCDGVPELEEAPPNSNMSVTTAVTIWWLFFDLVAHGVMTAMQVLTDKRINVKRSGFGLPFMTFLPLEYNHDFRGAFIRKIVLAVYVGMACLLWLVAVVDMETRDYDNFKSCSLGTLSCDLKRDNSLGCHQVSREYMEVLKKRYFNKSNSEVIGYEREGYDG